MDEREQQRKVRHRLAVLRHADEISGNVAATCRYYGISRPTFYKWLRQYEEFGEEGLKDRSSRPKTCPHQTDAEIVSKIVYLRQHYHFGPAKISMYLARYHEVAVSKSGVWRILKRLDMNRLPTSQRYKRHDRRWKRYEKQLPGHRVQVDVKFIEALPGWWSANARSATTSTQPSMTAPGSGCFGSLNGTTRNRRSSSSTTCWPNCRSKSRSSKPTTAQSSRGGFHWHLLDRGIGHTYIKPRTPRLNGKVERSHRIDGEEFYRMLDGVVIDDAEVFNGKLQEWEDFYNFNRPHGGLNGQTPYERLRQKTTTTSA